MSRPASKEKLVTGKRDAKIKSVVRDESFLRKPNNALQVTSGPLRVPAAPERRRWAAIKNGGSA